MVRFPEWLKGVLIFLIVLGVVFRFVNLNHKVYWHDEAYTSMRAAGYTRDEIDQDLFQNKIIRTPDLQKYQQLKPGSTAGDTIHSLTVEDPQHPPLYFLLTRLAMQTVGQPLTHLFNSPLTVARSLPAVISLLALPAMYALAWELFASHSISLLATTLIALSPFDVLFAQTARQYSLLTVMVILSSFLLLRAIRLCQTATALSPTSKRHISRHPHTWLNWGLYSLAVAIGLYTLPFFGLTLISHFVYVFTCPYLDLRLKNWKTVLKFFVSAVAVAILLFSPWIGVMLTHSKRLFATTGWAQIFPGIDYLLKLWTLSFTSVFFDLDFGFDNPWTLIARLPFLILIVISIYTVCRRTPPATWLFVLCFSFVPFLLLAIPDLVLGGLRSAVSRYLVFCYPGVQLAVAYFLGIHLSLKRVYSGRSPTLSNTHTAYTLHPAPYTVARNWLRYIGLALLVLASLLSLTTSALATSWWSKDVSYFNDRIADAINKTPDPLVISIIGDQYTNTGDLLSISYRLNQDVQLLLLKTPGFANTPAFKALTQGKSVMVFNPSNKLKQTLEQTYGTLVQVPQTERLWQLPSDR